MAFSVADARAPPHCLVDSLTRPVGEGAAASRAAQSAHPQTEPAVARISASVHAHPPTSCRQKCVELLTTHVERPVHQQIVVLAQVFRARVPGTGTSLGGLQACERPPKRLPYVGSTSGVSCRA